MLQPILINPPATAETELQTENNSGTGESGKRRKVHFPQQGTSEINFATNEQ